MPLYEYGCRGCGARFERMRKTEERLAAPACPQCHGAETMLVMSAPGFVGAHAGGAPAGAMGACDPSFGGCCGGGACMN